MKPLVLAALAIACAGAFVAGRARSHAPVPAAIATARSIAVADAPASAEISRAEGVRSPVQADLSRLRHALATGLRAHAAPSPPARAFLETAAERAERHRSVDAKLAATLGALPAAQRAELIELNDEATQAQLGLQAALLSGSLSEDDYDAQLHQRVVVQLEQLRGLVDDEQYRKLTGLEPGVDPYEYMRTGVGAAQR